MLEIPTESQSTLRYGFCNRNSSALKIALTVLEGRRPFRENAGTGVAIVMSEFNWLHISDWHEGAPNFDRSVVLKRLLEDIEARGRINHALAHIDLVIFSGDVAHSGKKDEFDRASSSLINPLKKILGSHVKFVIAPGNHDLDRTSLGSTPAEWRTQLSVNSDNRSAAIGQMLCDDVRSPALWSPFKAFYKFCSEHDFDYGRNGFVKSSVFDKVGSKIGICAVNSALCCARHEVRGKDEPAAALWDYGTLSVSEQQVRAAIDAVEHCDLRILVLHHPLSWLHPDEQPILDQLISANFDLVLHGHEHLPRFTSIENNISDVKYIPAGAAFERRLPTDPRFTSSINFGCFSVVSREGRVFHRRWFEERDRWDADDRHWEGGFTNFVVRPKNGSFAKNRNAVASIQKLYNRYFSKRPAKRAEITIIHEKVLIEGRDYLQATIRYRLDLYPGPSEEFRFGTIANKRILESASEAVRSRAYELISLLPNTPRLENDENFPNKKIGTVEIGTDQALIEYQYRILEKMDGLWYFSLQRFVDQVKINIKKSPDLRYEYLSIGGFPNLTLGEDNLLSFETMESDIGHLPHQGVVLQWYDSDKVSSDNLG